MNLLRSICCLFTGRCGGEEPEPKVRGRSAADLGQKEAKLEEASEEELRHMEGGTAAEAAAKKKRNIWVIAKRSLTLSEEDNFEEAIVDASAEPSDISTTPLIHVPNRLAYTTRRRLRRHDPIRRKERSFLCATHRRLGSIFDFRRYRQTFLKGGPVGDHQVSLFRDEETGWPRLVPWAMLLYEPKR
jgi:hypothetical protein